MRNSTKRSSTGFSDFKPILPLALVLGAATFWGVWTLSAPATNAATRNDTESASFTLCGEGPRINCIVDGDTLYYEGVKIRIADIDTPETNPPRCAEEGRLGKAATHRLLQLANAGPFTLQPIDRDEDRYGRKLRVLTRGGQSLGKMLVDDGLARWYQGGRRPWC
jgi:endonuclease YncB( thermonuclease family)